MKQNVLITGTAGFIGNHLALRLLREGHRVHGIDNYNPYYDVTLKEKRGERLKAFDGYTESRIDLEDADAVMAAFEAFKPKIAVNLAAQAGVRYSLENPRSYVDSNVTGFLSILEACRHCGGIEHLVYASTSSVYGANTHMPFDVSESAEHPLTLYAATKKANEVMAHSYSHLFGFPSTGLRFFTVYGPWGRPDMALFKFTKGMLEGEEIEIYNNGDMSRDFTYIDDIIEGIVRVMAKPPAADPDWNSDAPATNRSGVAPYRIYNIGNSRPTSLMSYIEALEKNLGFEAKKKFLPMQPGDVKRTWANVDDLMAETGYKPSVDVEHGVANFVEWFKDYYGY